MSSAEMSWIVLAEVAERLPLGRRKLLRRAGEMLRSPLVGRVGEALAQLIAEHTDQRVLLVAHGGVIWGTLTHFFPDQRSHFTKQRQVANCSITRIAIRPDGKALLTLNEISHLGERVTY
jgi:broad specificity phosphatase PhoE